LVVQPKASARFRDKILDHGKTISVNPVEHIVAMDADVVQDAFSRKAHPDSEVHYGVSGSWGVSLAQSRLPRRHARFDQAHVGSVLICRPQQAS